MTEINDVKAFMEDEEQDVANEVNEVESYQDYRQGIEDISEMVRNKVEEGMPLPDAIHEEVDSSRMVFVYSNAINVLRFSDSEPQMQMWQNASDWREAVTQMAFEMVQGDVQDYINRNYDLR